MPVLCHGSRRRRGSHQGGIGTVVGALLGVLGIGERLTV